LIELKANNYRDFDGRPYTRKKYIRGYIPPVITRFSLGNNDRDYEYRVSIVSENDVQIRSMALEAFRTNVNRRLREELGEHYFFRIKSYPHHILRENKMIFGAHADRLQDGMRKAFGKTRGTAARVKKGQTVAFVEANEKIGTIKKALKVGISKLPLSYQIETHNSL
jgi:large subunit ribosomal protein L10e